MHRQILHPVLATTCITSLYTCVHEQVQLNRTQAETLREQNNSLVLTLAFLCVNAKNDGNERRIERGKNSLTLKENLTSPEGGL